MKSLLLILLLPVALSAAAQTPQTPTSPAPAKLWSLTDCIEYAQRNNITVQQRALSTERSDVELSTARYSRLPNLNASASGDLSFGRALGNDNVYHNINQTSTSFNASTSMPIFQGMRINHQIKAGKLDLAAAMQDLERAKEDVSINIMTLYLQVLYNKEMVSVAERQAALSAQQAQRSHELVATGKKPESTVYESEALAANDQLSLTQARNDLQLGLLDLSQALNRESAAGFDITTPTLDSLSLAQLQALGSADDIYTYAAANRPQIKAEQLRLESAHHNVSIARSSLYPSLSLSGGMSSGFYNKQGSFWSQMNANRREAVALSLDIPIFNRRATRNSIRTAQIAVKQQQLTLTEAEQSLRKEIEKAWTNANAAYAKHLSAESALASAKVAFKYEMEKVDAGRSTIFDFNDAKTRMQKAEAEAVQAKYEFLFRSKILDFYRGRPLTL